MYDKNDNELLNTIRMGGNDAQTAFMVIYERYGKTVFSYCMCYARHREFAEDVYQDTFLKFYDKALDGLECTNLRAYLIQIAKNKIIDAGKLKKSTISIDDYEMGYEPINYENDEIFNLIISSIDILEEKYKEVFVMREFDGLSYKDIADTLSITVANAKSRGIRAKQKLISILSPYLQELK